MAINFAHVVPKEEVEKCGADFGHHPVGSGAYKMAEWTLGQRLVLERNADYWKPGTPKLDKITFEFGQEPHVALLRLQKGEVDVLGDGIPPAQFLEVKDDPQYARPDRRGRPAPHRLRDDERQDQAVRRRARAPGGQHGDQQGSHRPHHQQSRGAGQPAAAAVDARLRSRTSRAIAYDPEGAKKLLAEAGLADGFETELYVYNTDPNPRIAQAIQQDLAAIGIKAELKSLAQANVIAAGGDGSGADDLVGRHGLDRRLPRPVQLLRADPRLRRRGAGRLELVVVLQQGPRRARPPRPTP